MNWEATKLNMRRPPQRSFSDLKDEPNITKLYSLRNVPIHLLHQVGSYLCRGVHLPDRSGDALDGNVGPSIASVRIDPITI